SRARTRSRRLSEVWLSDPFCLTAGSVTKFSAHKWSAPAPIARSRRGTGRPLDTGRSVALHFGTEQGRRPGKTGACAASRALFATRSGSEGWSFLADASGWSPCFGNGLLLRPPGQERLTNGDTLGFQRRNQEYPRLSPSS